jgi:flagellar biosynthesis GTPase FlhF
MEPEAASGVRAQKAHKRRAEGGRGEDGPPFAFARTMAATKKSTKPATRKKSAKKPTSKKATSRRTTAKKPTAKKSTAKKSTAKKPTAKKPTAKKPASRRSTAKKSTAKKKSSAKRYGEAASDKVEKAMHERKRGTLRSGSGQKVTSKKQAIAIGLSQARERGAKVPEKQES